MCRHASDLWFLTLLFLCFYWFYSRKGTLNSSVQFSSVAQSCQTLCDPMNCSTPGLPVPHQHPEFTQTLVHGVGDAIQPSHPLSSPSSPAPNPSQHHWSFPVSQLFAWGGQSIGVSASISVLPMNTQDWSPLGRTGWIKLLGSVKLFFSHKYFRC